MKLKVRLSERIEGVGGQIHPWMVSLGSISQNGLGTKISQIMFLRPSPSNIFIYIYFIMFIYCMPKHMTLNFDWNKKGGNCYKFIFLIVVAPLITMFMKFHN